MRHFKSWRRIDRSTTRRGEERGAALVVAILVLAILTVIGIALMLVTTTESRIAANEWSVNRAFYASDAGVRWTSVEMSKPVGLLTRPEFYTSTGNRYLDNPWGTVLFQLPSHRHGTGGFFTGDTGLGTDINVTVQTPSLLGRRAYIGGVQNVGNQKAQFLYAYEVRTTGGQASAATNLFYSKALVADIELGPLPEKLPWQLPRK